ncbi:YwqJ-related putative deaminase [Streptomyces griseofuscus]|uniref:YwqJ-related putative deaminase n=1 Tax=Streptomyces griseofuscus TaxID=146922 RepID=UPI00369CADFB
MGLSSLGRAGRSRGREVEGEQCLPDRPTEVPEPSVSNGPMMTSNMRHGRRLFTEARMITDFDHHQLEWIHYVLLEVEIELNRVKDALSGQPLGPEEIQAVFVEALERPFAERGLGEGGHILRPGPPPELVSEDALGYLSYPVWLVLDHFQRTNPQSVADLPGLIESARQSLDATVAHDADNRAVRFVGTVVAEDDHHGGHQSFRQADRATMHVPLAQMMAAKLADVEQYYRDVEQQLGQLHAAALAEEGQGQAAGNSLPTPALDAYRAVAQGIFAVPAAWLAVEGVRRDVEKRLAPLRHGVDALSSGVGTPEGPMLKAGEYLPAAEDLVERLRWVSELLSRCLQAVYQLQPSNNQRSRLPSMTGALHVARTVVPATSLKGDDPQTHRVVQFVLDQIPPVLRGRGHGKCSEIVAVSAYIKQWAEANGQLLLNHGIVPGTPGYEQNFIKILRHHFERSGAVSHATYFYKNHSYPVQACQTCRAVLTKLAISWIVPEDGLSATDAAAAGEAADPAAARERLVRQRQWQDDQKDYWVGPDPRDVAERPVWNHDLGGGDAFPRDADGTVPTT